MPGLGEEEHVRNRDAQARAQPAAIEDPLPDDEIHLLFDRVSVSLQSLLLPQK